MARTYWKPHPDGSLEFLGVYPDGHMAKAKSDQAAGRLLDIIDKSMAEVEALLKLGEREAGPPMLTGLPAAIAKRFQARMPVALAWQLVEGYVK